MKRALVLSLWSVVGAGCWDDWQRFFDPTPSTEHRVEDLRVLAMELLPLSSRPEAALIDLVDPRGGAARVELRACLRPAELAPCVDRGVALGAVEVEFVNDEAQARIDLINDSDLIAFIEDAGIVIDASPVFVDLIADVVKLGHEPLEREVATVTIPVYDDLRIADNAVDHFRTCVNAEDPAQNPVCFGEVDETFCGDNVVEGIEACEPPGLAGCNEFCQRNDEPICPQPDPACLVGTPQNEPPHIVGVNVDDAITDEFTVPVVDFTDGDFDFDVDVAPGDRLRIQPIVADVGAHDTYQPWIVPFFDLEACGTALTAGCPTEEIPQVRFYVEDVDIDIVVDAADEGVPVNARGSSVAEVVIGDSIRADQPLWIVVVDGRGGMGLQRVTLHVR